MRKGWQTVKLGEVCKFQGGSQPPKSKFIDTPEEGYIRLLQIRDFKSDKRAVYIPEAKKNRTCIETDIMIGRYGASVGQIHRGKAGAYNVALIRTSPNENVIYKNYFYYFLISSWFQNPLMNVAQRSAQAGFSKDDIHDFQIPLPPLPEQERIVSILDKAFEGIDQAIAQTEQNLASARELFESYLNNLFTQKGEDWVETTVKDLVEDGLLEKPLDGNHGEIHPKKADFVDEGIPFIMASDLQKGEVNQLDCNHIKKEQAETLRKGFSKQDDVLMSHKGTIGRVAILNTAHDYIVLTPQVTYYRITQPERLYNRFVYYYFQSPLFQRYIKYAAGAGSTRAYIGITKQLDLPMAYPSLARQKEIVGILDLASGTSQQLEALYTQKLNDLKELKQSLLQQAFAGELTKEDAA